LKVNLHFKTFAMQQSGPVFGWFTTLTQLIPSPDTIIKPHTPMAQRLLNN
jgi:hypothetical protein